MSYPWWNDGTAALVAERRHANVAWKDIAAEIGCSDPKVLFSKVKKEGLLGTLVPHTPRPKTEVKAPPRAGFPKRKPCLKCRRPFLSQGPHNHLCPVCRSNATGYGGDIETLYAGR
ncbi:MAG: hypothetical protein K2X44_09500 [Magnetospirillum sp.]|nr:hypothetical protein [Magnetospirillum sp.]